MPTTTRRRWSLMIASAALALAAAPGPGRAGAGAVPVDVYSYVRAESDLQFKGYAEKFGCFGRLVHTRRHYPVDRQVTHSGNRDTIYSFGVFDLTTPVTVTLPDPGERYMSLQMVSQDHSIPPAKYGPGTWTLTREQAGTRYIMLGIRVFADPNDPEDMRQAHALQDAVRVEQADPGVLELPDWDVQTVLRLREAANVLGSTVKDSSRLFGEKGRVSYLDNLMGVALGWGGLQRRDALYLPVTPEKNDGKTPYVLHVPADVPVDGFWSVTVYDANRFLFKNPYNAYSYNNVTAEKNADGSVTIHFGGDPDQPNFLPIVEGWHYIVRLYRPRPQVLNGEWVFPAAVPVAR